ncbi:Fur family transcriptional regulator [Demequina pelophila]|uniref:Fur family transcriptional regulator n=1 Tax=Demequina pelophila TaxID=1638984 RepID=UPI0007856D73|nr:Fur family transcriptional regulator [Demequina pelophila]
MSPDDARVVLREASMRVTETRVAVIAALRGLPHAPADAVYGEVSKTLPTTSLQAVYNVLHDLEAHGLARRIEPGDHRSHYELRVGDNHHHLVCTSCGAIADVDCLVGAAPCLTPDDAHGFAVAAAEITFWGECRDCRQSSHEKSPTVPTHT